MSCTSRYLRCLDRCVVNSWECTVAPGRALSFHREGFGVTDKYIRTLNTGDIVLFRFSEQATRPGTFAVSACPWGHVGLIYVEPKSGERYVIDSTGYRHYDFCVRCLDFGVTPSDEWRASSGPQMFKFVDFYEAHAKQGGHVSKTPARGNRPGRPWRVERVAVRRLLKPLDTHQKTALTEEIARLRDTPYEESKEELFNAAVDICDCLGMCRNDGTDPNSLKSLFCAELAGHLLMCAGVLDKYPQGPPASEYYLSDFASESGSNVSAPCGCCIFSWMWKHSLGSNAGVNKYYGREEVLAWPRGTS